MHALVMVDTTGIYMHAWCTKKIYVYEVTGLFGGVSLTCYLMAASCSLASLYT